ncbi:MAG: hypothetical protein ACSHXF_10950 [Aquaticitalea sp.]
MRTNNSQAKNIIISVYFILIVLAIFSAIVFSSFRHLTSNPILTFALIALFFAAILFFVHRVSRYFEYDSDGSKVIVINRGLILADYANYREQILEFEKDRLAAYQFNNYFFYRTLDIHIRDRKGGTRKETFNITLLPKKKRRYIRQSLSKIVKMQSNPLQ